MKVAALIVCHNPHLASLRRTCTTLIGSGAAVILVDNTENSYLECSEGFDDCILIVNGENLGIARAQNAGIARAVAIDSDAVVFFDQDSQIDSEFLPTLLAPLSGGIPGVVGPASRDSATGFEYPSLKIGKYGTQTKVYANEKVEPYDVDIVISSGTATTVETFQQAGVMDEDFFIDFVDTEWCLRCRKAGVSIRVIPAAVMRHSVGNRSIDLRFARILVHSPTRCYYQIRNCFHLFAKDSVPLMFAVRETLVIVAHKALLLLSVSGRGAYVKAFAAGLRDGLAGVVGKKLAHSTVISRTSRET